MIYEVHCQVRKHLPITSTPIPASIRLKEHKAFAVGDIVVVTGHDTFEITEIQGDLPSTVPWRHTDHYDHWTATMPITLVLKPTTQHVATIDF